MKKPLKIILVGLAAIILIGAAVVCIYTGEQVFKGCVNLTSNESTALNRQQSNRFGMDMEDFAQSYRIEQISIASSLGTHEIPADFISVNGEKNKDTVILVHGLGGNRLSNYPIAEMFLRHGFNVITYDQRATGENLAQYNTFGYLESSDTIDYVNYAAERMDADKRIVLWGTSFGGATVGMAMADDYVNQRVCAAVLDCPVSSMSEMARAQMESIAADSGIPLPFLMWTGNIALRLHLGFGFDDAQVADYVKESQIPLLVINSKVDEVTPFHMGKDIFFAAGSQNKDIFTSEDSPHANVFFDYREEYERRVFALLDSILTQQSDYLWQEKQLAA